MAESPAFVLSRHFTKLINRKVSFTQLNTAPDAKGKQVYGIYTVFPDQAALIVAADLDLLGSLAGALVGLPDSEVRQHLKANPLEELLRDAMNEIFNVGSAVVTIEGRAVFQGMATDKVYLKGDAQKAVATPLHKSYYKVDIEGYQGGKFAIFR